MDLAKEDMERLELRRETKSIGSNGKCFRAVATLIREKLKEKDLYHCWVTTSCRDLF